MIKFELQLYPGIMFGIMTQTGEAEFPNGDVKRFTETAIYIPFVRGVFYKFS